MPLVTYPRHQFRDGGGIIKLNDTIAVEEPTNHRAVLAISIQVVVAVIDIQVFILYGGRRTDPGIRRRWSAVLDGDGACTHRSPEVNPITGSHLNGPQLTFDKVRAPESRQVIKRRD